jgi:hypothetical protein
MSGHALSPRRQRAAAGSPIVIGMDAPAPLPDVYAVLTALVRIESELRLVANNPTRYAPNGHYEKLVNLTTLMQAELHAWLQTAGSDDQRHGQRRQGGTRRTTEDRRTGPDRREAPAAEA